MNLLMDVMTNPHTAAVPLRDLDPKTDANFRFACASTNHLSRRMDKPHIWYYAGYWRVNLWNHKRDDLKMWDEAHGLTASLNALPLVDRVTGLWPIA